MVLFDTTMVNSQQSGGVYQKLVRSIDSVDSVRGLNWSQYVLTSLVKAKGKYGDQKQGSFGGSVLFLVLLYLERVVHQGQRQVARELPVFKGWTDNKISSREKSEMVSGGFGRGRIEAPMDVIVNENTIVSKEDYYEDLLASAIDMSRKMKEFAGKLNNIPIEMRQDPPILSCYELGKTVLGRGYPEATGLDSIHPTQVENILSQGTPGVYNDPTLIRNMKMIDEALRERDQLFADKWPNFDLGIPGCGLTIADPVDVVIDEIRKQERANAVETNVYTTLKDDEANIEGEIGASGGIGTDSIRKTSEGGCSYSAIGGNQGEVSAQQIHYVGVIDQPIMEEKRPVRGNKGKEPVTEDSLTMRTPRPRRGIKPSIKELSLYVCRFVDPDRKNNSEQTMLVNAVKGLQIRKILFDHSNGWAHCEIAFRLWTDDCVALLESEIPSQVLDVWALRINYEEEKRSPESPFVYFVPPSVTNGSVCNPVAKSYEERFAMFSMKFYEAAVTGEVNLSHVDMVMFPICDILGHYVICFHLKKGVADILDGAKGRETDYESNYKTVFEELKMMLTRLLDEKGVKVEASRTSKIQKGRVLLLDWKNTKVGIDAGVYVMRHMETYKGDGAWRCGFRARTRKNINSLRMKYLHCILTADVNQEKSKLMDELKKGS